MAQELEVHTKYIYTYMLLMLISIEITGHSCPVHGVIGLASLGLDSKQIGGKTLLH